MDANEKKMIIYLDRNENQYGPAPACLQTLKESDFDIFREYSRDFSFGIKSRLSERIANDFGIDEKNVMLGYGSEDILKQAVQCYIHKGDKLMIPSYSWWYYKKIASEVEGINVEYPIVEGEEEFYYDIEGMIKVYEVHKPKLVLISTPNNPTGNHMDFGQIKYVLGKMKDTIVVLDKAYAQFNNLGNLQLKELVQEFPNVLILRTFSKYYGLAGVRIGFALVGENHKKLLLFGARYLGFNRLSEKLAITALDSNEYYEAMVRKMTKDRDMYFTEFNKLTGFKAYRSYANFILVKIPSEIKERLKEYLTEKGMIIKFMDEDSLNNHVRITIGTQEQNLILMNLVKDFVKENG
jgi:histidinol-phosphate aminotransferase